MPKLFCISDVHGYYDEMIEALNKAGFDRNNSEHWLISCGDHTDRGRQPQKVMDYLMSLPRCILIKGNHESLLVECIERGFPYDHDHSNGTFRTIADLAPSAKNFNNACIVVHDKIKPFIKYFV